MISKTAVAQMRRCNNQPPLYRSQLFGSQLCRGLLVIAVFAVFCGSSCSRKRLQTVGKDLNPVDTSCATDDECPAGHICVFNECVPVAEYDCRGDQTPLVEVSPLQVDFGEVALGDTDTTVLLVRNVGQCNLTVSAIGLSDSSNGGYSCSPCDLTSYPRRVAPQRALAVDVTYTPIEIGDATGELLVRADDPTLPGGGVVRVPVSASYSGEPILVLDPPELAFGFVNFMAGVGGSSRTETIRISNQGSGNAVLTVEYAFMRPGTDFSIPDELGAISPANPVLLPPFDPRNPDTWLDVPITFSPTENANQETLFTVQAHAGDSSAAVNVDARISGSSLGPPVLSLTPDDSLTFTAPDGSPLGLGRSEYKTLLVQNLGQSELTVDLSLDDPSGDFYF